MTDVSVNRQAAAKKLLSTHKLMVIETPGKF